MRPQTIRRVYHNFSLTWGSALWCCRAPGATHEGGVDMTKHGKVVALHQSDSLAMPLAEGCVLRVTPFHESPRVALTIHGPAGGDRGGVILHAERARLLASW